MDWVIGVDYASLEQNPNYELPPSPTPIKEEVGLCVKSDGGAFSNNNPKDPEFVPVDSISEVSACSQMCERYTNFCNGFEMAPKCKLILGKLKTDPDGKNIKGDGTAQKTCYVKQWPDLNDPKYKQFVLPSKRKESPGKAPIVRYA